MNKLMQNKLSYVSYLMEIEFINLYKEGSFWDVLI